MPGNRIPLFDARHRIPVATVAICLALAVTFLGSLFALGFALYGRSVSDARTMAVALEQYALRTVTTAELVAQTVGQRIMERGGLRDIGSDIGVHLMLAELSRRLPEGGGIIIVDPTGVVVSNYAEFPAKPVDLADRGWFSAHRAGGMDFLIDEALTSRVTGRKMFIVTQAVRGGDGGLIGIVNLGIPSDALIGAQALPESYTGAVLTLMRRDGGLLARSDFADDLIGRRFAPVTSDDDSVGVVWSRDVDGRMAIEATDVDQQYGLVARASLPLLAVLWPLIVLTAIGLPLLAGMMVGTIALARSLSRQQSQLQQTTARLQVVLEAAHLGAWHLDVRTGASEMNERWARIVGHEAGEIANSSDEWVARLHPDERDSVLAALADVVSGQTPLLHREHRLRHKDGHWVWVLDSGCVVERDAAGNALVVTGTLLDISERRESERRIRVLMAEVDHRAKNLLAVVHSLINLMPPDDLPRFRAKLLGRIKALGHVHTLLSEAGWKGVELGKLIRAETAPFQSDTPPMITASGPEITLHPAAAQAFAMVMHELMTNAAKYGALTAAQGVVRVSWTLPAPQDGQIVLRWEETGGPAVLPPAGGGFGSRLLGALVSEQLEGQIERLWPESGLIAVVTVPMAAVAQKPARGEFAIRTALDDPPAPHGG